MNNIKISVIVPVYNVEKYVAKCIKSLVNQTLSDIEIICIDDGSKDNSINIIKDFAINDKRIKILTQKNQGISVARNKGLEVAAGEFVSFVDSDDWIDLDFYEKLYNSAKENNCDIACAGFKRCGQFLKSTRKSYKDTEIFTDINSKVAADKLPDHNYVWGKIFKREKLELPLFAIGRYYEDVAVLIKLLYTMGDMVTVPNTYYNYRKNFASVVYTKSNKHSEDWKWALEELYKYAREHNITFPKFKDYTKKDYVNLFGITIMKIYYKENLKQYKLFGFIPFVSIRTKYIT